MFTAIRPTPSERARSRPGDDIIPAPDVVMDRAFTLPAPPETVWPWLVQLGKKRAGWYLPRSLERLVPPHRRALRHIDPAWQKLAVGDTIPDWGGRHETFQVAIVQPPHALVHRSLRGNAALSWSLTLDRQGGNASRLHLRLRLAPVRHRLLVSTGGELLDALTVAGLAAGLRERLTLDQPCQPE